MSLLFLSKDFKVWFRLHYKYSRLIYQKNDLNHTPRTYTLTNHYFIHLCFIIFCVSLILIHYYFSHIIIYNLLSFLTCYYFLHVIISHMSWTLAVFLIRYYFSYNIIFLMSLFFTPHYFSHDIIFYTILSFTHHPVYSQKYAY